MAARIETPYTRRARCSSSAHGFSIKRPAVPAQVLTAERDRALDPAAPSGLVPLDLSGPLRLRVADAHSPHDDGDHLAPFLVVQDGGTHDHTRTMGFSE